MLSLALHSTNHFTVSYLVSSLVPSPQHFQLNGEHGSYEELGGGLGTRIVACSLHNYVGLTNGVLLEE